MSTDKEKFQRGETVLAFVEGEGYYRGKVRNIHFNKGVFVYAVELENDTELAYFVEDELKAETKQ